MSGIVNMSRGATRPAVLLLVLVSLFAPNARAWEAECHFEGRACDGQRDEESALADWDGEHRTICLRTLDAADFPAELVTGELALPVPSDASGLPTTWTAAVTLRQRDRTLCEFAELPDFSYGLDDWSGVHSGDCPVPTHPSLACHNFFTMGAYNSTHFGAQAGAMYRHYHAVALGIAEDCAAIKARVVAAEEEWRAIEERRGESVPFEIRADDELKACEATAYAVEAVGQHYLTDNWSSGHMWQRWGGPTAETVGGHTNGLLVSIATGLLHGATFPGFEDDPMGAPHPDVHWVLPGRYEVPTPGVGDTYLDRVLEGDEYAVQRERLLGCAVDGFADVYNAGPKMWHESDAAAMAGLEGRSFDEARCLGPLVTNAAMEAGLTAEMVGLFGGHSSVPWRDLVRDPNQLAVIIRGFLGSYPGLADELDPHWDEFAESYARVAMDIEYRTFEDAQGYDAASGCQL